MTGLCCIESVPYGIDLRVFSGLWPPRGCAGTRSKFVPRIVPRFSSTKHLPRLMPILKESTGLLTRYILYVTYYFMIYTCIISNSVQVFAKDAHGKVTWKDAPTWRDRSGELTRTISMNTIAICPGGVYSINLE